MRALAAVMAARKCATASRASATPSLSSAPMRRSRRARNRRTFAIRGGEPLYLDFRINGSFMGREIRSDGPPRLSVHVRAHSPVRKVEVVRDGKYVFTRDGSGPECQFEYKDTEKGNYYYVRVWLEGDKYAWSTPAWVD